MSFRVGALRSNISDDTFAVGTEDDFVVVYPEETLDSERYYASGRFDKQINDRIYWVTGAGWQRDTGAGIQSRVDAFLGIGNTWKHTDKLKFTTDYTLAVSSREYEIEDPLREETHPAARLAYVFMTKVGQNTKLDSDLVFYSNRKTAEDWSFIAINAVTANLTAVFAHRASLQLTHYNFPALEELELFEIDPSRGDAIGLGTVITRKKKLDTVAKITLVVTF